LAASVILGATGCTLLSPQDTVGMQETHNGVSGEVGQISVRNALLLTGDGDEANLVVTLVNTDTKSHRVTIKTDTDAGPVSSIVTVEPASPLKIGGQPGSRRMQFSGFTTPAGSEHKVYFQYGDQTGVQLSLPVLTTQLPEYSTLTPTPAPVSAAATN